MPDWVKIRNDYINGAGNAASLGRKYGVNDATIRSRAKREGWQAKRRTQQNAVETICNEKTAEAVAQAEADRIDALMRIGAKAAGLLERRLDYLREKNQKAYEVKAIMEAARLIRDVYKTDGKALSDDPLEKYLAMLEAEARR